MPLPRLRIEETALLVIDMQEKLLPSIAGSEAVLHNCSVLLSMAAELQIPALVTEHYPQGLGRTVAGITAVMVDPASRIEKTRFSAVVPLVEELLRNWRRTSVLVCGIEAQVCVLQSVLDLLDSGRQPFVVSDAIGSSQPSQIDSTLRRTEAAGAITTGVMSAMYEMLADARHPSRRRCVELAKRIAVP